MRREIRCGGNGEVILRGLILQQDIGEGASCCKRK